MFSAGAYITWSPAISVLVNFNVMAVQGKLVWPFTMFCKPRTGLTLFTQHFGRRSPPLNDCCGGGAVVVVGGDLFYGSPHALESIEDAVEALCFTPSFCSSYFLKIWV